MTDAKRIESIADLTPDSANPNRGTSRGRGMLEDSVREDGAGRSILVDKDGNVIAGNKTVDVAAELDLPVRVVQTDGTELVVVQRTDVDAKSVHGRRMAVRDNRTSEVGLEWDIDVLAELGEDMDLSGLWNDSERRVWADILDKPEPLPDFDWTGEGELARRIIIVFDNQEEEEEFFGRLGAARREGAVVYQYTDLACVTE